MDSLVNYGSDDDQDSENDSKLRDTYDVHGSNNPNRRRTEKNPDDGTNYEAVRMDLSEDSDQGHKDGNTSNSKNSSTRSSSDNNRQLQKRESHSSYDKDRKEVNSRGNDRNNRDRREHDRGTNDRDKERNRERERTRDHDRNRGHRDRDNRGHDRDRSRDRGNNRSSTSSYAKDNYRRNRYDRFRNDNHDNNYRSSRNERNDRGDNYRNSHRRSRSNDRRNSRTDRNNDRDNLPSSSSFRNDYRRQDSSPSSSKRENESKRGSIRHSRSRSKSHEKTNTIITPPKSLSTSASELTTNYRNEQKSLLPPSSSSSLSTAISVPSCPVTTISTNPTITPTIQELSTKVSNIANKSLQPSPISLPSYYNPNVINPNKYAEQIQKRKLLWSNKKNDDATKKWGKPQFAQDSDGKVASKFMRLMGIKSPGGGADNQSETSATVNDNNSNPNESIKRREEMFSSMEQQYEVARQVTHTMRGVGLGFGSQPRPF